MKIKIAVSAVFALLLLFSLTYNIVNVKAENIKEEAKFIPFNGNLYKYGQCNVDPEKASYIAVDRTTGITLGSGNTDSDGYWSLNNAPSGHLIYIKFTNADNKVVCFFQTQTSYGLVNLKVCMTNGTVCLNEE